MLRKFADILAVLFHPVFMGTAVLLVFLASISDLTTAVYLKAIGLILLFTLVVPVAATYFLHKDIHLQYRKQRFLPLLATLASHMALYFFLKPDFSENLPMIGVVLLSINLVVLLLFTTFIKASMHANAIAIVLCLFALAYGIIGALEPVPPLFYIIATIASILFGIVIWQRVVSKAHTVAELVAGFFSGLITIGLTLIYIERFGY